MRERMGAVITARGNPARPWDLWCAILEGAHLPRTTHEVTKEQFKLGLMTALGFSKDGGESGGGSGGRASRGYKAKDYTSLSMSKLSSDKAGAAKLGEEDVLSAAFGAIDSMSDRRGTGSATYEDMAQWINGSVAARQRALEVNLATRARKPGFEAPLAEIEWTEGIVREELQTMLLTASPPLSSLDLMLAYDKDPDGKLSRKEWTVMMKKLLGNDDVWAASNVKEVALATFDAIAGSDAQLSIEEFQRWLVQGWVERKHVLAEVKAAELRDLCRGGRRVGESVDEALERLAEEAEAAKGQQPHQPHQQPPGAEKQKAELKPPPEVAAAAGAVPSTPRGASIMALFAQIDSDGDGTISEEEAHLVARLLECNPSTFWKLLLKYDTDGDGTLGLGEFEAAIKGRIFAAFFPGADALDFAGQIQKVQALIGQGKRQ
jgi:hypothetical protein